MPDYDFYSPFMSAAILIKDEESQSVNQRVPLWIADSQSENLKIPYSSPWSPSQDRPYLQELTIKENLGGVPIITARLVMPYHEALAYLDSHLIEWGTSQLEVILGYSTGEGGNNVLGPPRTGLMQKPEVQIGPEVSIVLNAQGIGTYNLTTESRVVTHKGTRANVIEGLLRGSDTNNPRTLTLNIDSINEKGPEEARQAFQENIEVCQGGRTSWQVISRLIWEVRCWMIVDGDDVVVFHRESLATQEPLYAFSVHNLPGGEIGPKVRRMPILSASSPTTGVYLPSVVHGIAQFGIDRVTRTLNATLTNEQGTTVNEGTAGGSGSAVAHTGDGGAGNQTNARAPGIDTNSNNSGADFGPGNPANQTALRSVQTEFDNLSSQIGVKLELDTLGIPDLLPGHVISIEGLGKRIDANYWVMDVVHTFGTGGYTTHITAISNAQQLVANEERIAGPTNTNRPPDPANSAGGSDKNAITRGARLVQ